MTLKSNEHTHKTDQSSDRTCGSIVSECRLGNLYERGLKTVSFNPKRLDFKQTV